MGCESIQESPNLVLGKNPSDGEERKACLSLDPGGFFIRHPPAPNLLESFITPDEHLSGWAWSHDGIALVHLSIDHRDTWIETNLQPRTDFSWQLFTKSVTMSLGPHQIIAWATSSSSISQPMSGRRNHMHTINVHVRS
jgi:hypothetical protein